MSPSQLKNPLRLILLIAPALDMEIRPNNCIIRVAPPNVLSASSFVAAFPSNIPFISYEQPSHEYGLLEIERYLYVAFFLSISSAMNALTPTFAISTTQSCVDIELFRLGSNNSSQSLA